jgi:ribosome-binding factor A
MESKRQKQVAEMIKRNISIVLQEQGPNIYGFSVLVTVTQVVISPDLSFAKIYLSIFNTEHKQETLLLLDNEINVIKHNMAMRIRKLVRKIPAISFFIDDTIDEMYQVDFMMKKLERENQFGEEEAK